MMFGPIRRHVAFGLAALIVLSVAGCGGAAPGAGPVAPSPVGTATARDETPEQSELVAPLGSNSAHSLALYLADQQGLWRKYGLTKVDMTVVSSTQTIPLFLGGRVNIMTGGGYLPLPIIAAGGKARAYGWITDVYSYDFYVQPEIQTWADLKGKAIGISAPGGLPHLAAVALLEQNGVKASEVTFVSAGDVSAIVNGLIAKQVAGGAFGPPATDRAKAAGLKLMAEMLKDKVPTGWIGFVANPDWVAKNPKTAKAYMKGVLEGVAVMLTKKDIAIQALAKALNLDLVKDKATLEASWDLQFKVVRRPNDMTGQTSAGIYADMVRGEVLNGRNASGVTIDQVQPQPDLIEELRKEGFFKYLEDTYGKIPPRP